MELPQGAQRILDRLLHWGYPAQVVGGCVRDSLLGRSPHDWDICTAALPQQVKDCFAGTGMRLLETGIRHGTVTLLADDGAYEVTTYRTDGDYLDHRHPGSVQFVSGIADDLARRDFTINAMAYSPADGLLDLFGGRQHLQERVLCCVGDPNLRFSEDALRILRALRFAATYGFTVEQNTADAIRRNQQLLSHLSQERRNAELLRLLCGSGAVEVVTEYLTVLEPYFPVIEPRQKFLCRWQNRLGEERLRWLLTLQNTPESRAALDCLDRVLTQQESRRRLSQLAVNGTDLRSIGIAPGAALGAVLDCLLEAVAVGQLPNDRQTLLNYAQNRGKTQ
ncbi:MAG: hypothetical protein RR185_02635 [Angelakisella sp.]